MSKYNQPFSTAKRKTITISNSDPRSNSGNSNLSRVGSKVNTKQVPPPKTIQS